MSQLGALDTETSIQVMDLLKEVAKDRLVVMVTHNPELAQEYATRVVNLRDGKIISDSNPFEMEENKEKIKRIKTKKTSMSLLTALSLSFQNLKTKKGRTILTSFAGSIGIIGIALILSISNGVNNYIGTVEEDTLSEYPIQINSTGMDISSMLGDANNTSSKQKEGDIHVTNMLTNMFATIGSNDLKSLKEYLEGDASNISEYAKAIEYTYDITPRIYSSNIDNLRQVNPDTSLASLGISSENTSNSMISSMMSTNMFHQMPSNISLFQNQYDVKAGKWPTNYNECVLVLTSNGNVSDFLLYTLGLRDSKELENMVKQFSNEEEVDVPENLDAYSYDDILNTTFKLINSSDCYEYDSEYKIWRDKTDNISYMKKIVKNGEDLKIVGIVQPKEGVTASMLQMGIYYPASLTEHVIEQARNSKIVKEQLKSPKINVFTGKEFDEQDNNSLDMNSLIEIDENKMKSAFKIDESKIKMDFSGLNNSISSSDLPNLDVNDILENLEFSISEEQMEKILNALLKGYQNYLKENNLSDITKMDEYLKEYLQTDSAKQIITSHLLEIMQTQNLNEQLSKVMANYMNEAMKSVSKNIEKEMTKSISNLSKSMANAITIDTKAFADSIHMKLNEEELKELFTSLITKQTNSYESNLKELDYADKDIPDGINIYPKDFESNEKIKGILEEYNTKMTEENQEEKVISYTDLVGTLMSSVTTIIDVISYVLIAFVAISLVVSSIMIGVITYISVLERRKEIGILRAIGASKHNISQVFNAETFIIGLLAGLIGVGVTLILLIPINQIIYSIAQGVNVTASLPVSAGIILIILSVILTLIGGIIPSKKAAKEDPVLALRTE